MAQYNVYENPANGYREKVKQGFNFPALLFGPLYYFSIGLVGKGIMWLLISILLAFTIVGAIIAWIVAGATANRAKEKWYLKNGWKLVEEAEQLTDSKVESSTSEIKLESKVDAQNPLTEKQLRNKEINTKTVNIFFGIVGFIILITLISGAFNDNKTNTDDSNTKVTVSPTPSKEELAELRKKEVLNKLSLSVKPMEIDSADGATIHVSVTNSTGKVIKYLYIRSEYYNSVDDILKNDIDRKKETYHRIVGPFNSGTTESINGTGFYNDELDSYSSSIDSVEFMDGEKIWFD